MSSQSPESAVVVAHAVGATSNHSHVLYTVKVTTHDGKTYEVAKRYSEFAALQQALGSAHAIPPKRILVNILTFIPTAWVDARLIAERKAGFDSYMNAILADAALRDDQRVAEFFAPVETTSAPAAPAFNPEDALPSKFTREMSIPYLEVDTSAVNPTGSTAATEAAPATLTTQVIQSAFVEEGLHEEDRMEALAVPVANPLACAYYPDWSAGSNPPEKIDFSKFDILFFAFVTTTGGGSLQWGEGSQAALKRLVASAKKSGKHPKIILSVGGWGGSASFSDATATAPHRTKLVSSIADALKKFKLDGVDVDWEFPNSVGAGNKFSPHDSDNLLAFFKQLRSKLGASKLITSAVTHLPWLNEHSQAIPDVSAFAAIMSFVNIMNYDVWGSGNNPGPNAPLSNKCGTSGQPHANAKAALAQWTKAGFPANKILLGLPNYGYVSKSKATRLSQGGSNAKEASVEEKLEEVAAIESEVEAKAEFKTDSELAAEAPSEIVVDAVGGDAGEVKLESVEEAVLIPARAHSKPTVAVVAAKGDSAADSDKADAGVAAAGGDLSKYWNTQIAFKTLLSAGALVKHNGKYVGGNGFTRAWDNCSDTPFLFNTSRTTVVAYDDPDSIQIKAEFAKKNGMAGCFTWSMDQDDGTTLQEAMRRGLAK